jgi:hypothetical protein
MPMYLKLPADYVDPVTQAPLPDGVLEIDDVELRLHAGDVRVTGCVYASVALMEDVRAAPTREHVLSALSMEEITQIEPALLEALYNVLLERPAFAGASLIGAPPSDNVYNGTWNWQTNAPPATSGHVRSDSHNWEAAVALSISSTSAPGTDTTALLRALLVQGNTVRLQAPKNSAQYARYTISGPPTEETVGTDLSFNVPVELLELSGQTPNAMDIIVAFILQT